MRQYELDEFKSAKFWVNEGRPNKDWDGHYSYKGYKHFWRFLFSNVGRPFNNVKSSLLKKKFSNALNIRDLLATHVYLDCEVIDGAVYQNGKIIPRWKTFYVDQHGILCYKEKEGRQRPTHHPRVHFINEYEGLVYHEDGWWRFRYRPITANWNGWDVILGWDGRRIGPTFSNPSYKIFINDREAVRFYGRPIYAYEKTLASQKDLERIDHA